MVQQYQQFRKDPATFLGVKNMPAGIMSDSTGKAAFEYMTGQQIPDEYANNPRGYLQSMISNMPAQQGNTMLSMAQMFMK